MDTRAAIPCVKEGLPSRYLLCLFILFFMLVHCYDWTTHCTPLVFSSGIVLVNYVHRNTPQSILKCLSITVEPTLAGPEEANRWFRVLLRKFTRKHELNFLTLTTVVNDDNAAQRAWATFLRSKGVEHANDRRCNNMEQTGSSMLAAYKPKVDNVVPRSNAMAEPISAQIACTKEKMVENESQA